MIRQCLDFRHLRKSVAGTVLTLDETCSELAGVDRVGVLVLECRVTVVDREAVLLENPDRGIGREVGEFHLLAVPVERLVEGLEPYGCYAKVDHLAEWTCLAEV